METNTMTPSAITQPEGYISTDYVVIFIFAFALGLWIGHKLTRSGATSARQVEILRTQPFTR